MGETRLVVQLARSSAGGRLSLDGRYSVHWLGGYQLTLWNHDSGLFLGDVPPHQSTTNRCSIGPDGRYLAYPGGHELVIQDLDEGGERLIHVDSQGYVHESYWSRDGSQIFVGHSQRRKGKLEWHHHTLTALRVSDGKKLWSFPVPDLAPRQTFGPTSVTPGTQPDQVYVLTGDSIREVVAGQNVRTVRPVDATATCHYFALSRDGRRAVTTSWSEKQYDQRTTMLTYWDWTSLRATKTVTLGTATVPFLLQSDYVALSPDGKWILAFAFGEHNKRTVGQVQAFRFGEDTPAWIAETGGDVLGFSADSLRAVVGTTSRYVDTGKLALPEVPTANANSLAMGVQGDRVIVAQDRDVTSWDLTKLKPNWTKTNSLPKPVQNIRLTPDGQHALLSVGFGADSDFVVLDVATGTVTVLPKLVGLYHDAKVRSANEITLFGNFGYGGTKTVDVDVAVWNIASGNLGQKTRLRSIRRRDLSLTSPDGRWDLQGDKGNKTLELVDLSSGKVIRRWLSKHAFSSVLWTAHWTPYGVVTESNGLVEVWSPNQDQPLAQHQLIEEERDSLNVSISPDGNSIGIGGQQFLWQLDAATGTQTRKVSLSGIASSSGMAMDRDWAVVRVGETPSLVRLSNGHSARLIRVGDEWVAAAPDGIFTASAGGGRLLAAVQGRRGFFVDQYALTHNDPARLMSNLEVGSEDERQFYAAKRRQRLRRAGVEEPAPGRDLFESLPTVEFTNTSVTGRFAEISLEARDARGLLSLNVDVNGVPKYRNPGRALEGKLARLTERVELSRGENRIELRVVGRAGLESMRPFRLFRWDGQIKRKLYFIGFGVSKYANPNLNLDYPHKDVLDVAAVLAHARGDFDEVETHALVNEQVTPEVIKHTRTFLEKATVDDTVVVMVAGHGVHGTDDAARYYFATYGTVVNHLAETAAPFEHIEALLDGIAPRQKLMLMDTCESGEQEPEEIRELIARAESHGLKARTTRGLTLEAHISQPRAFVFQTDSFLFQDLMRRTGSIVLSSSSGSELSYENPDAANGVFTEAVLRALTSNDADANGDAVVDHRELRRYVGREVAKMTGGAQHPTVDRDNTALDFGLPVTIRAAPIASRLYAPLLFTTRTETPKTPESQQVPPVTHGSRGCACALAPRKNECLSFAPLGLLAVALLRRQLRWSSCGPFPHERRRSPRIRKRETVQCMGQLLGKLPTQML